jgi:hypothetical protein
MVPKNGPTGKLHLPRKLSKLNTDEAQKGAHELDPVLFSVAAEQQQNNMAH